MKLTVDASVFVESFLTDAVHKRLCFDLLAKILDLDSIELIQPTVWLFEVSNAIGRQTKNEADHKDRIVYVQKVCVLFMQKSKFQLVDLDKKKWNEWYASIVTNSHKFDNTTQDEQFLDTAWKHDATLITLEKALIAKPRCAGGNVKVLDPYQALILLEPRG